MEARAENVEGGGEGGDLLQRPWLLLLAAAVATDASVAAAVACCERATGRGSHRTRAIERAGATEQEGLRAREPSSERTIERESHRAKREGHRARERRGAGEPSSERAIERSERAIGRESRRAWAVDLLAACAMGALQWSLPRGPPGKSTTAVAGTRKRAAATPGGMLPAAVEPTIACVSESGIVTQKRKVFFWDCYVTFITDTRGRLTKQDAVTGLLRETLSSFLIK